MRAVMVGLVLGMVAAGACTRGEVCETALLDEGYPWYGDNRGRLNALMEEHGRCAPGYAPDRRPVAVFDWDNTVIKGDIGDGVLHYMLEHNQIRRPPSWEATSEHLTAAAVASLSTYCPLNVIVDPLPTATDEDCTTAILCVIEGAVWSGIREEGTSDALCTGAAAWALAGKASADTMEPAYAWVASLQAGHTAAAIRRMAQTAFGELLAQPIGATRTVGHVTGLGGYIRVYPQIADLIAKLHDSGFDVWISSASAEPVIAAVAPASVGVPAGRVIGTRHTLDAVGRATYRFAGCGSSADGNQALINYRQGKRCWLNKLAFGVLDGAAQMLVDSPTVFAAGDADTDVFLVQDARALRLAINRNRRELMCRAYANVDGRWIINPRFIEPLGRRARPYECSPYGLPDQDDTVYCAAGIYDSEHCSAPLR